MGFPLPPPDNHQQDHQPPPPPPENSHSSSTTTTTLKTQTSTCEICIEPMELSSHKVKFLLHCDHPYCLDCMIKYICAKLDDNIGEIPCPAPHCNQFLDPLVCQPLLDPKVFVRWCDVLCESEILDLETSYCPNRDCSALIVNECGGKIEEAKCPSCNRPFCFKCMHPWHGVLRCDESQEFRESGDIEFGILAKNRGWIRCPRCRRFVVERVDGCQIISCRCRAEFCYACGKQVSGHWCRCQRFACIELFCRTVAIVIILVLGILNLVLIRPKN